MSPGAPAITVSGVSKRFGPHANDPAPLQNITLNLEGGSFTCLVGPTGCGKSTLLRLMAGLESPSQGSIAVARDKISFVFQEANLLPWRTLINNTALPLELRGDSKAHAAAQNALERVALNGAEALFPHQLSGGMKMRASLARALITHPDILLLDEPFAALDEVTRLRLEQDLWQLWRQQSMTVVFVTHSLSEAAFLSQRVIMLSKKTRGIAHDRRLEFPGLRDEALRASPEFLQTVRELQVQFAALDASP